jgi:hypothetical protein
MLPELQERYRGHFSPYIQAKIENLDGNRPADRVREEAVIPGGKKAGVLLR